MSGTRKFVTTGVGFTFVVVGTTGILFQFFFKNQTLTSIHGWIGTALVAAGMVHVAQNWKPLRKHLQDRRVFLLLIPIFLLIATVSFASFGEDRHHREGNPREVMQKLSQASVRDLAKVFGKDVNSVLALMAGDRLRVGTPDQTLSQLAQNNQKPPEALIGYFVR
jgi:hypothetical protein